MTTIKVKKVYPEDLDKLKSYVPEIGEIIYDKKNKKVYFGDFFTCGGYPFLLNDKVKIDNNKFYGNINNNRDFYNFPYSVNIHVNDMITEVNTYEEYKVMPTQEETIVSFGFGYSPYWNKDKDINFRIIYSFDDNGNIGDYVNLITKIYLLYEEDSILDKENLIQQEELIDKIKATTENINNFTSLNLSQGKILSNIIKNKIELPEYIIVEFIRKVNDTFIGDFKISDVFIYQEN